MAVQEVDNPNEAPLDSLAMGMRHVFRPLWIGVLASLAAAVGLPALADPTLSGMVHDTLGNGVSGVEVLVIDPRATATPAAVARTDPAGRFAIVALRPGVYKLAAVKRGYDTFVGKVDTLAHEALDVVLHPAHSLDARQLPQDDAWALRLPRRGALQELASSFEQDPAGAVAPLADSFRVQLDQLLSVGAGMAQDGPSATAVEASETRVDLVSRLGERNTLRVEGRRERLGSLGLDRASAGQTGNAAGIGLSCETGEDSRLDIDARVTDTGYQLASHSEVPQRFEQEQRSSNYRAGWVNELAPGQRVGFGADYREAVLDGPQTSGAHNVVALQALGAQGSYGVTRSDGHALAVALRADSWKSDAGESEASVWDVSLDADDHYRVSGPLVVRYGIGMELRNAEGESQAQRISPRVGADFSGTGWSAHGLVAYHATSQDGPRGSIGYEAGIEIPVTSSFRVEGSSRRSPWVHSPMGYVPGAERIGTQPIYVTDGNAAVTEHRLAVVGERKSIKASAEWTQGQAHGTLAPVLGYAPTDNPTERQIEYRSARLELAAPSLGTDLAVEYRRLRADAAPETAVEAASEESVELRLAQRLSSSRRLGDWRVLLALHLGRIESAALDAWALNEGRESVDALNRRLSGGVSVLF
jgi:hypothetical protein